MRISLRTNEKTENELKKIMEMEGIVTKNKTIEFIINSYIDTKIELSETDDACETLRDQNESMRTKIDNAKMTIGDLFGLTE